MKGGGSKNKRKKVRIIPTPTPDIPSTSQTDNTNAQSNIDFVVQLDQSLGMRIDHVEGHNTWPVEITEVVPESQASKAGIVPGMFVVGVNGESTAGKTLDDVIRLVTDAKTDQTPLTINLSFANAQHHCPSTSKIGGGGSKNKSNQPQPIGIVPTPTPDSTTPSQTISRYAQAKKEIQERNAAKKAAEKIAFSNYRCCFFFSNLFRKPPAEVIAFIKKTGDYMTKLNNETEHKIVLEWLKNIKNAKKNFFSSVDRCNNFIKIETIFKKLVK